MNILTSIWNLRSPYITQEGAKKLLKYKYSGNDASILHNYCWSPMADKVTIYVPNFIAYF